MLTPQDQDYIVAELLYAAAKHREDGKAKFGSQYALLGTLIEARAKRCEELAIAVSKMNLTGKP